MSDREEQKKYLDWARNVIIRHKKKVAIAKLKSEVSELEKELAEKKEKAEKAETCLSLIQVMASAQQKINRLKPTQPIEEVEDFYKGLEASVSPLLDSANVMTREVKNIAPVEDPNEVKALLERMIQNYEKIKQNIDAVDKASASLEEVNQLEAERDRLSARVEMLKEKAKDLAIKYAILKE